MKPAADAIPVDTSRRSLDDVVSQLQEIVRGRLHAT
jgi:cytidylate kinase